MSGEVNSSMSSESTADLLIDCRCMLGEGIVWCDRREAVLWTDIESRKVWMHHPASGETRSWELPDRLGSFALCESGKLLLALAKGLYFADIDASTGDRLEVSPIVAVEADNPATRSNDGRTDRAGNFVFGTMADGPNKSPVGSFYQYSRRHGLRRLDLGGVAISNSICFSPDGGTLYYCDSLERAIKCCDYDADTAGVANPRVFIALTGAAGAPDGSTIDADGFLWNAQWGSARVVRYTPDGTAEREIAVSVTNPSCVSIGGVNLDQLFITTARSDMSDAMLERMPDAGGVFRARLEDARGLAERRFADT